MPKMLSWAKKISGRSSPKKSGQEPVEDKGANSEKIHDAEEKIVADNKSSLNNTFDEKSSSEKERARLNSTNAKEIPSKEHSPPKHHSPSKSPSPEKKSSSVKKTPSFAKRFASFRIPGLDRKSPDKSSRSKSRSPELETTPKDSSPEKSTQNESPSRIAVETVHTNNQNLRESSKSSNGRVTENGSEHEKSSIPNQEPIQSKPCEANRPSNTDRLSVPVMHPTPEESANPLLSKFGRRSISEKLYGEVIKEFDKIRTTRSRMVSDDFGSVTEENESVSSETLKDHSLSNSDKKDSKQFEINSQSHNKVTTSGAVRSSFSSNAGKTTEHPWKRNENTEDKLLTKEMCNAQSSHSRDIKRCESEKERQDISDSHISKDLGGESELGGEVTTPSADAQNSSPKPVLHSLTIKDETSSSSQVEKEKNLDVDDKQPLFSTSLTTQLVIPSSSAEKGDSSHHASSEPENILAPAPKSSPSKFSSSSVNKCSLSSASNTSSASIEPSVPSEDTLTSGSTESTLHKSDISQETPTSENPDKTLDPSANASKPTEEKLPSLLKADPLLSVNDKNDVIDNTLILEEDKETAADENSSPQNNFQAVDSCESSPPETNIEKNNAPVPSVRLSKLPKPSDESVHSSIEESSTLQSEPSPVNHLPSLSKDCNLLSTDDIQDTVKNPSVKASVVNEESSLVHSSLTNERDEQVPSLSKSSEETDSLEISCHLTDATEDQNVSKTISSDELQETGNAPENEEKFTEDRSSSSDAPSQIDSKASSQVHTDPEVSVVSCSNLDEFSESSKFTPSRTDTCDSINSSILPSSVNDNSHEISINSNVTSPTSPQRSLHEKMHRSSEEVRSQPTFTFRHEENRINKEMSKTYSDNSEYPSSGEGGSLPASPSVPRRRKKSHPVPVARSLQTLSATSSGTLTVPRDSQSNRERPNTPSKPPPRPPIPTSLYSPTHPSPSSHLATTTTQRTSTHPVSSNDNHTNSQERSVPQVKKVEYNPFDSDEDAEEDRSSVVTSSQNSSQKISLNPFESDEDEDKEDNNNQAINKKIQLPSVGYNPFDEDEDENGGDVSSAATDNSTVNRGPLIQCPTSAKTPDDSIVSQMSQSSKSTQESTPKNPFDEDEDEDENYDDTSLLRQTLGRQSLAVRSSSTFQREGVRASLPSGGRGRCTKKKRQAPLPPGFRPSPATTPLPPRNTMMMSHGESYTSLYDPSSLRKNSTTSVSTLSLSSPKKTPPPRPPPPKIKSVSLAQL